MTKDNIKLSNICNVHPEYPSVNASKVMVYFELHFSSMKCDINRLFD